MSLSEKQEEQELLDILDDKEGYLNEDKPNWKPLEHLAETTCQISCGDFMWMGSVSDIQLYKQIDTRQYINIDTEGFCWKYSGDNYKRISQDLALSRVIGWRKVRSIGRR